MKNKAQAQIIALLVSYWWVIALIILFIYGFTFTGSLLSSCNLGNWGVTSYDSGAGILRLSANAQITSDGCLGGNNARAGTSVISEQDCIKIGWNYQDGLCKASDNWYSNQNYSSSIVCSHTQQGGCCDASPLGMGAGTYCGPLCGQSSSDNYKPAFDGYAMGFDNMKRQLSDSVSCSGDLAIQFPQKDIIIQPNPDINNLPSNEITTNKDSVNCLDNLGCKSTCNTQTPTCQQGKCYCDNKEVVVITQQPKSIIDKIIDFIGSLFSWL